MVKVNVENFKKKLIYTTAALMTGAMLSGCNAIIDNSDNIHKIPQENNKNYTDDTIETTILVNFTGTEFIEEPDLIVFYDKEGNIYNIAYSDEGTQLISIEPTDSKDVRFSSNILDAVDVLPEITEDQNWEITFDYYNKKYDIEVIEKEQILESQTINSSKLK